MHLPNPSAIVLALVVTACASSPVASSPDDPPTATPEPAVVAATQILLPSQLEWGPLNPARGDKGPKAANLWGDRNGAGPSGFLVRFTDGFSSPPHIHNVSYRGVVIHGLIHNDDPSADEKWMPTGSFWTQPKGGAHITAAKGSDNLVYVEIDEGPYLVQPVDQAFHSDDEPMNVAASSIVWREQSTADAPKVASLWGEQVGNQPSGTLVELAAGSAAVLRSNGSTVRAVLVRGQAEHRAGGAATSTTLEPGSYFSAESASGEIACGSSDTCILYVRHGGGLEVVTPPQPNIR